MNPPDRTVVSLEVDGNHVEYIIDHETGQLTALFEENGRRYSPEQLIADCVRYRWNEGSS